MIRLIDVVADKYFNNKKFDENERFIFSELRKQAANIYLSTECLSFNKILEAVFHANRSNLPHLVEKSEPVTNSKLIRYLPAEYALTVLPENYFSKEKVYA